MENQNHVRHYYNIHGILRISVISYSNSIAKLFDKEFESFRDQGGESDLTIVLGGLPPSKWVPRGSLMGPNMLYDRSTGQVTILRNSRSVYPTDNIQFLIKGDTLGSGNVSIYVPDLNVGVSKLLRIARMLMLNDFLNDDEIVTDYILTNFVEPFLYYQLPSKGYSLVHASAVSNGSGIMFYGLSNVGKTAMTLKMVKEGFEFLGDDLVILSENGQLLSYPKRIKLETQHLATYPEFVNIIRSNMSSVRKFFFNRFVKNSSHRPFETMFYNPTISEIYHDVSIADHCDLGAVIHLERTMQNDLTIQEIDTESCLRSLTNNLFWEFNLQPYRHNQYIYCSSCLSSKDFLGAEVDHHNKIAAIIEKAISNARKFQIQLPNRFSPPEVHRAIDAVLSGL